MSLAKPKLYAFQLERKFTYPTSGLELADIFTFILDLWSVKVSWIFSEQSDYSKYNLDYI